MAFNLKNWSRQSVALNTGEVDVDGVAVGGPAWFTYRSADDTAATIAAANYFANVVYDLSVDDLIFAVGSDAVELLQVATINRAAGTITTVGASLTGMVDTANIVDGAVTNAKVNAAAAIDFSKLAALPDGEILVGSAADVPTPVAMSGDATIINTGALTIANNAVTSAKLAVNVMQQAQVAVSAAEWNGMYAAPKQLVAAGGANTQLVLHAAKFFLDWGAAQFASGGAVHIQYDSTANGAGTKASGTIAETGINAATADSTFQLAGIQAVAAASTTVNKGLFLSNATGAFTTGDSTFKVDVWYSRVSYA